jgi:YVTN family beta-propeller protein
MNLVIASIATGQQPSYLLHDSIHDKVYCANWGSGDVTVIDAAADSVVCTVSNVPHPAAVVHNPSHRRVYIANSYDSSVVVLRDTGGGIEEGPKPHARSRKLEPTVMRTLPQGAVAFDAMGRRVLNPRSGIFFIRDEGQGTRDAGMTRKVVIQR